MAKFLENVKSVGTDMVRVVKDDPMGTALDVFMTLAIGTYLFLNKMSGYYTGREHAGNDIISAVKEWADENMKPLDETAEEVPNDEN